MPDHPVKYILLLLYLNYSVASAQYISPNSLNKTITTSAIDTERINAMNWLSFRYYQKMDSANCRTWAETALKASLKIKYKNGEGFAFLNLGNLNILSGNDSLIRMYWKEAKAAFEAGGDKGLLGVVHSNMALHSMYSQSYLESLGELNKSLRLQQESGFQFGLAHSNMSLGVYHYLRGDFHEAEKNLLMAAEIFGQLNETILLSYSLYYAGVTFAALKKYNLSLSYLESAKELFNNSGEAIWFETEYNRCVAMVYLNRADSCLATKNQTQAADFFMLAEKHLHTALQKNTINDADQYGLIYNNLGWLYLSWKKLTLSRTFFLRSLETARTTQDKRVFDGSYEGLARIDSMNGDYKSAFRNYRLHILYRDSIIQEENMRAIERYKIEYETEKKIDEIKLLTAENKLKNTTVSKQKQQKNFALAGIVSLVIIGGYAFFRYRQRKKLENDKALSLQQQAISRDLHDEIGATLSGIAMYSHMVKSNLDKDNKEVAIQSAGIIQESSTEMVNKLNDIVWLIKPQNESMKALVERLEIYTAEICAAKNIKPDIQVGAEVPVSTPPLDKRKNIYLICKEAINNAVKYSGASVLSVHFAIQEKWLHIAVKDNGCGFNPEINKNGNGLANMSERAAQIGAVFTIHSSPGNGCNIELKLKITR